MKKLNDSDDRIDCPDWQTLYNLVKHKNMFSKEELEELTTHIEQCQLCTEDLSLIREEHSEEIESEPSIGEATRVAMAVSGRGEPLSAPYWLKDLAHIYPSPTPRTIDMESMKKWLREKVGNNISRVVDFFGISNLQIPALSPIVLRNTQTLSEPVEKTEIISRIVSEAENAIDSGDYYKAGELYSELSSMLTMESIGLDLKFLAGIAYIRAGDAARARNILEKTIDDETESEHYWALACAQLVANDMDAALKNLQIVESMGGELGKRAKEILDEIVSR